MSNFIVQHWYIRPKFTTNRVTLLAYIAELFTYNAQFICAEKLPGFQLANIRQLHLLIKQKHEEIWQIIPDSTILSRVYYKNKISCPLHRKYIHVCQHLEIYKARACQKQAWNKQEFGSNLDTTTAVTLATLWHFVSHYYLHPT